MDATFISIHDVTPEARILYSSDSVIDILGYQPDELVNRSCWEFFPEDELPYAQSFHQKRVSMDKAAVLAYCRMKSKTGEWVGCECCFTIVYDVMIVCTSVYEKSERSDSRALAAPVIRRLFSSSPRDPRYHMLSHLSAKFNQPSKPIEREPRAALFLNRFTRTLTIMYATLGILDVIGLSAEEMRGKSFYYCVAENCLQDAIKCLENAKGNDSIAYLRFWFRDPRYDDPSLEQAVDDDVEMTMDGSNDNLGHINGDTPSIQSNGRSSSTAVPPAVPAEPPLISPQHNDSRASSGDSLRPADTHERIFGIPRAAESSASSLGASPVRGRRPVHPQIDPIELEAVISCASDGLVVCLRRARPMIPHPTHRPSQPVYSRGLFAAPWANDPVLPPIESRPGAGFNSGFAPSLGPMGARHEPVTHHRNNGPDGNDFMAAIRDQAIFAWALTGINGALAEFGKGKPLAGSVPSTGLPVWTSDKNTYAAIHNGDNTPHSTNANGWTKPDTSHATSSDIQKPSHQMFGDPGLARTTNTNNGSGVR